MTSEPSGSISVCSEVVCHGLGEPRVAMGEGRGVMSTSGPTPGEEKAEAGDKEPARCRDAERADLRLLLRDGSPMEDEAW